MPNWCSNTIEIKGDKESIDEFKKFLDEGNGKDWFNFFLPTPTELKDEGWYMWNVNNWGCKWNCDAQDWKLNEDGTSISFWFDSPWSPPTTLYETISDSYDIDAHYLEEGMGFIGRFCEGYDDYYEYTDLESLDDVPEELLEKWDLRERLEEQQEWDDEDE
jgi:hypothetical protein